MWSNYDEDLSQNEFFKQIKENHADILEKAAQEGWIVCVPRKGILKSEDFSMQLILDHILIPNSEDHYTTMNKKDVQLNKRCLILDQNNIFHTDVEVLFEETHYIEKSVKYLVWCVNSPLFLRRTRKHSLTPVVLTSIQDCIDFLYLEGFGRNLLESIQNLCVKFWTTHNNEFEMETLQSQKDSIGNLYSQCLQLCFKSDIIRDKCDKNINYLDNFKLSIETYMQYCLGKKLMYSVNTLEHFTDCIVNKIIRNSFNVGLEDLNISIDLNELIIDAKYEISRINSFITVLDKINCLSRIFNIFNNKTLKDNQTFYVTSDDYLQILIYLILKTNNPNWVANLTYIKEFQFTDNSQTNFFVVNLEAAISFIKSNEFLNTKKSSCDNTIFSKLYNKFKNKQNIAELYKLMQGEKAQLCHPLCSCPKCETKKPHDKPYKILNNLNQNFLIIASMENQLDFLEFLLTLDYEIDFQDDFGKTALHYAAEIGLQDILMLLINAQANVNILDNDKNTALHLACDRGHDNCVKALIYSSPFVEINLQNTSGETPLFLATRWGYFDIIKILLENGASVCIKNNRDLSIYKLSPNLYITKLFKQFGKQKSNNIIKEVINSTKTQDIILNISEACSNKLLTGLQQQGLTLGTPAKSPNELKKLDLLFKAIINNDLPLSCFYLGYNSNTLDYDNTKCHPLCTCNKCSNNEDDSVLASNITLDKFNVNMCNIEGFTPLHLAAKYGRTEILRILLDSGAPLNVCDNKTFYTPLHLAVMFQRVQTVKELLKCGNCNVDAQDVKGNTPLYYACVRNSNNLKIIESLLQNGADCQKRNCKEQTVLQICEVKNLFRVCRMLRESMGYPALAKLDKACSISNENYFDDDVNGFEFL
ncbi:unnamed protein product [Ceutorhynchus assimilis]|uniref:VPS9 domain-containing protein n=1 Tax=Ceutorhynchus assimilis TaxID=467358 RepID=A0A9N9QSE7_9CUCU|nr:unnamed protein product [Ceutorhynchus assimilis]